MKRRREPQAGSTIAIILYGLMILGLLFNQPDVLFFQLLWGKARFIGQLFNLVQHDRHHGDDAGDW